MKTPVKTLMNFQLKSPRGQILTSWSVSPEVVSSHLSSYYLLSWKKSYFIEQYYKTPGQITHQGHTYLVLFYDPMQEIYAKEWEDSSDLWLSFRKLKEGSFPYGYVLIRRNKK